MKKSDRLEEIQKSDMMETSLLRSLTYLYVKNAMYILCIHIVRGFRDLPDKRHLSYKMRILLPGITRIMVK